MSARDGAQFASIPFYVLGVQIDSLWGANEWIAVALFFGFLYVVHFLRGLSYTGHLVVLVFEVRSPHSSSLCDPRMI